MIIWGVWLVGMRVREWDWDWDSISIHGLVGGIPLKWDSQSYLSGNDPISPHPWYWLSISGNDYLNYENNPNHAFFISFFITLINHIYFFIDLLTISIKIKTIYIFYILISSHISVKKISSISSLSYLSLLNPNLSSLVLLN